MISALLASCAPARSEPAFTVPWADGEETHFDLRDATHRVSGHASWTLSRSAEGWTDRFEVVSNGKPDHGEVVMNEALRPLHSFRESGGGRTDATYAGNEVVIKKKGPGDKSSPDVKVTLPAGAIFADNSASLEVQRALPFAPGLATRLPVVVMRGEFIPVDVDVEGEETVTVPAGSFATYRVKLSAGGMTQHAWYQKDAPRLLVKYVSPGASFELRSWRASKGAPLQGQAEEAPVEPKAPAKIAPIRVPLLLASILGQWPMMLGAPFLVAWWVRKRTGLGWPLWARGALTFILSQVVHIPLNWALGLSSGTIRGVGTLSLPVYALALGLSAGLCEELARYVMLKTGAKQARSYGDALVFGAGHGGIEALVFGGLIALGLVGQIVVSAVPNLPGLEGEALNQAATASAAYWSTPWYLPILGGFERLPAMVFHIAATVLVVRAVARGKPGYLIAAILAHTATDALSVWAGRTLGPVVTEVILLGVGLASLATIWALREPIAKPSNEPAA